MHNQLLITIYVGILFIYTLCQQTLGVESQLLTRKKRALFLKKTLKWTNGIIPYKIDESTFSQSDLDILHEAITSWNDETCIKFIPFTGNDTVWVNIFAGNECRAGYTGMPKTGNINISLKSPSCSALGIHQHELGHAIGLEHEVSRYDRDKYIFINESAIKPEKLHHYAKFKESDSTTEGSPYDYRSIMHSGAKFISVNAKHAMEDGLSQNVISQPEEKDFSFWDVRGVNTFYQCGKKCQSKERCKFPSFLDKNCICQTPEAFVKRRCVNNIDESTCMQLAGQGKCILDPGYMSIRCRKTCNYCYRINLKETGTMTYPSINIGYSE